MKYESICYMDTDVYIQGSFDAIWTECRQNIMLYDINHGLNTRDYVLLCDEIESYCGQRKLITHYGGEFLQHLQRMQKLLLTHASRSIMKCSRKIL